MLSGRVLRQIIVVTDGRSNAGICPVRAAEYAFKKGITVNAIGILDTGKLGVQGSREVKEIAKAGGGVYNLIPIEQLSYTIQTVTVEAVRQDIARLINYNLQRAGGTELKEISPRARSALISAISEIENETEIHLILAIDSSGSMIKKRTILGESLRDLMISMAGRRGEVKLGIVQFPGFSGTASVIKPLFSDNRQSARILREMVFGGMTPTGPAILTAVKELAAAGDLTTDLLNTCQTGVIR